MGSMAQIGLLLVPSDALGHTWALPGVLGAGQGLPPESGPGNLKADWLDERSTYLQRDSPAGNERVEPACLGADGPPSPPPSPRDLQCCLKVRQVRHRAPKGIQNAPAGGSLQITHQTTTSPGFVLLVRKESWSIFLLLLRGGSPDTGILRSRPQILGYCERFPFEILRSNNTSILRAGTADTSILVMTHPVSITVIDPRWRSIPISQS